MAQPVHTKDAFNPICIKTIGIGIDSRVKEELGVATIGGVRIYYG